MLLVKNYITSILVCILPILAIGQNLVKNPSFELNNNCPEEMGNLSQDVKSWSVSTFGTTDYFNTCSSSMGVPNNFNGSQAAKFGEGYAGLYMYAPNDYREYLQAELLETLKKGSVYNISFYISLSDKSDFAIKDFEVLFSSKRVIEATKKPLTRLVNGSKNGNSYNFVRKSSSGFYQDRLDWTLISAEFMAKGTENFITLGNFKSNSLTKLHEKKNGKGRKAAYYYLDMVSVTFIKHVETIEEYKLNKVYVFNDVEFITDKYDLQKKYSESLQNLCIRLKEDPSLFVSIFAHTDNRGGEQHNQKLSNNRAKEVADYLIDKGIALHRISWKGKGNRHPVATNGTNIGRQKNRRAEFVLTKNGSSKKYENNALSETVFEEDN